MRREAAANRRELPPEESGSIDLLFTRRSFFCPKGDEPNVIEHRTVR